MRLAPAAAAAFLLLLAAPALAAPVITAEPQDQTIGSGENGAISVTAPGATSYQWFKGASGDTSAPVPGATGALCITLPLYASGQFWVQASDGSGSTSSRTVTVNMAASVPGRLMGMGDNNYGQLGGTETEYRATPLPIATGVTKMDAYSDHTLYIKEDGSMWSLGFNQYGQLGRGGDIRQNSPIQVPSDGPIVQVSAGSGHSLFLRADGTAWAMGLNTYGQLGNGNTSNKFLPEQVMVGVVQVAAASSHSHFLKADGTLWATGQNSYGRFGNGTTVNTTTPTQVASGVASVATRSDHTLILKTDGTLWAAGNNSSGQLGDGTLSQRSTPVQVATSVSYCAAGFSHSFFRKTDGIWWAMGYNYYGELGDGTSTRQSTPVSLGGGIRQASAGNDASLWVKDDGLIRAMGDNSSGQAGDGTLDLIPSPQPELTSNRALRVVSGSEISLFLDASPRFTTQPLDVVVLPGESASFSIPPADGAGIVYQWYRGAPGDTSQPVGTGLSYNVAAPVADDSYWVRISNAYGSNDSQPARVIIATVPSIQTPPAGANIAAGEGTVLRVVAGGGGLTYQWYSGTTGDTSIPLAAATADLFVVPALYATRSFWVRVSTRAGTADSPAATITVAPAQPATLRSFGLNSSYQLGTGDKNARDYPEVCSTGVISFSAGQRASYFIKSDHSLWEAGNNTSTLKQDGTGVISVSGGESHTLFIKQDFSAWGLHANGDGQLGDGSTTDKASAVQVATNVARVSTGRSFSFFVKTDGSLWATGKNDHAQFGIGTWENSLSPIYITSGVIDAVAGNYQGYFLKADGTLWGMGDANTLGIGYNVLKTKSTPVQIASGVSRISGSSAESGRLLFLKTDGSLWSNYGSTDLFQMATGVAKFAAGGYHKLYTKTDGSLWGTGYNYDGQLGIGKTPSTTSTPVAIATDVLGVSAGTYHSLFTDLKPGFSQHPFSGFVAVSTSVPLSVTGIGTGTLTYQWYRGERGDTSQPLAGEVSTTYNTPILTADARYWVRVTNDNGSWDSLTAVLTVVGLPQITTAPVAPAATIPPGGSTFMSAVTSGLGLSIQWYRGQPGDTSSPVNGATGSFLVTPSLTGNASFWVRVSNAAGSVHSSAVPVSVGASYPSVLRSSGSNNKGQLGNGSTSSTGITSFTTIGVPAVDVAAGANHSLFVEDDGSLWAMGENTSRQLGDGTFTSRSSPVVVAQGVVRATASQRHSLFLKQDGTLWGMGVSTSGQLGSAGTTLLPRQVASGVVQVSTGDEHTLYLKADGSLLTLGSSSYGQAGPIPGSSSPLATGVIKIAAGGSHSLFLKSDGTVWAMGLNGNGQLGDGSFTNRTYPLQVAADLAGGIRVVDIAAGGSHSLLLRSNGTVWACGSNNYGQAGLGSTSYSTTWQQVAGAPVTASALAAGAYHSFILGSSGALYATGRNNSGQLGTGNTSSRNTFGQVATGITRVAAGGAHSLIAASPPQILSQSSEVGVVAGQTPTLNVAAAGMPSFTYQWYRGESGDTSQPIASGNAAGCITPPVVTNASYWVRVTGPGGSVDSGTMRVIVASFPVITTQPQAFLGALGAPAELFMAASGGALSYQWYYGSPGDTSTPVPGGNTAHLTTPPLTASVSVWVRITNAAGTLDSQAALITAAPGQLVTLGARSSGQLGDGGVFEYPLPQQVANGVAKVRATDSASFILKPDGSLWGAGSLSWIGGFQNSQESFTQVASNVMDFRSGRSFNTILKTDGTLWIIGVMRSSDEDPDFYHDTPVQVASGVTAVWAGSSHYIYLSADGTLRGAGDNYYGQLGDGMSIDRFTPIVIATGVVDAGAGYGNTLFVKADGSLWGCGFNDGALGSSTFKVPSPAQIATGVNRVFAGSSGNTFFIKSDGSLWGCGENSYGQLGDGSTETRFFAVPITTGVVSASLGFEYSLFVKTDGSLWATGRNLRGQLGNGNYFNSNVPVQVATEVAEAAAGDTHSLYVDSAGRAWAAGGNSAGQFGIASEFFRDSPEILAGPVSQVAAGEANSFFVRADGSLLGMGSNRYGELGDGSRRYRYIPVEISGGVKRVSAGSIHTLFLKTDDSLWGMGANGSYALGNVPGPNLLPVRLAEQIQDFSAGSYHSLFARKDGTLWGMGRSENGQLGLGDSYENSVLEVATQIATGVSRVSAGDSHSLFLKTDGTLWAMGSNSHNQSGGPFYSDRRTPLQIASGVREIAAGYDHSVWVDTAGILWGIGANFSGQLGDLPGYEYETATPAALAEQVARVWAGNGFTLFLKKDGSLWGLGYFEGGALGEVEEGIDRLPKLIASGVLTAAAGWGHTLVVTAGPMITEQPEAVTVTAGSSGEFTVAAIGNGPLAYQWFRGLRGDISQAVDGATSASFTAPPATAPVNYWVRVSNPYAHVDSRNAVLAIAGNGDPRYQSWAARKGLANLSPQADPDQDGLSNHLEYFFNTDPLSAVHGQAPVGAVDQGSPSYLTMSFRHLRNSGVDYEPRWSPDLVSWSEPETWYWWVEDADVDGDGTTELIHISRPIGAGEIRGFLRLELSEP